MKFGEFEKLLYGPDRIRIFRGEKIIYEGYFGMMNHSKEPEMKDIEKAEIIRFRAVPEIRHRKWKERGLDAPMLANELQQYGFSDLMMTLYYTIYI